MTLADEGPGGPGIRRASPVRHVLTIFGDYWWHIDEPMPTGALVRVLGDLGLKEAAARATLARMSKSGLLVADRDGRRTTHRLTERAVSIVDEEAAWLDAFGVEEPAWDGLWTVLAFSIPESQRSTRHLARSRLKWLGFAPLYDGVWVSPLDHAAEAMAQLRDLGIADVTAMRATLETSIPGGPQAAWDLQAVAEQYRAFATAVSSTDATTPVAAFVERTRLMLSWQAFRVLDTGMPAELVPTEWPRASVRRSWMQLYNRLGAPAEEHVRGVVGEIDAGASGLVTRRRLTDS
ncbi:PaaX family transcriptional regulator [Microbacterium sp. HD4P20]|uniref:PaaX family transcriptional regulator n=1 Tax=Microbacterium sp. HD4P20 TaxID=2864874 RepID=UPI001C644595|nr:PaaX family transcriptional regulator C-terminal domain-containing protein [Microbacterium sp. HD4P20]MCP2635660.1 PaaX family transcriptional regulator [Microbacterium sp. HD4P20]